MNAQNILLFTIVIFILYPVSMLARQPGTAPSQTVLSDGWTFSEAEKNEWLPAIVPGTVHQDLLRNHIISDPHYRLNESDVQWIEEKDWEYRTTFYADNETLNSDAAELWFQGLDTYASVYLNDILIMDTNNMFITHKADVKNYLIAGNNELRIYFHSPVNEGLKKLQKIDYYIPAINEQAPSDRHTSVFTRKAPFHFGWDWGPRLVTSGIWRPVLLVTHNYAAIDNIYLFTRYADNDRATLGGRAEIEVYRPGTYTLSLNAGGLEPLMSETMNMQPGINVIPVEFEIENPKLWWTNGLGDPHLYNFRFDLNRQNQVNTDHYELSFGIRTLRLVQKPDTVGRSFYFELNGIPVFMKGANVIPSETLTPAVSDDTYHRLFDNAVAANMNMLRVWGGAIYEEDLFYELADKHGILIWQDFMFACNLQPGDEAHLENIRQEAEYNVKRLRNHPSIALWSGNNENLHGWHHWGWKEMYEPSVREFMWRTYERIFHEILPDAVNRLDPDTPYWSSSPSAYGNQLADRRSGDEHDWTIWFGQQPFSSFGQNVPRFISEYGMQAFPGMHTIREFSIKEDWDIDSPVMRHRQRGKMPYIAPGFDGNDMINRYMERYYLVPDTFEHFVYVSQIMHAKAYKTAIEAHRRNMPITMGSLYWQLNDSWPTISWATVDYYGRWKAAHYAVRKAYEEVLVSPVFDDGTIRVYIVSDRLGEIQNTDLQIILLDFYGQILHTETVTVTVAGNQSTKVFEKRMDAMIPVNSEILESSFMMVQLHSENKVISENLLYFGRPLNLKLPKADVSITTEKTENGYILSISSDVLARNVFLDSPYNDLFFEDNFFDLIPGETKKVVLKTDRILVIETDITVLSLNDLQGF
jgi:beta-mannosidase